MSDVRTGQAVTVGSTATSTSLTTGSITQPAPPTSLEALHRHQQMLMQHQLQNTPHPPVSLLTGVIIYSLVLF